MAAVNTALRHSTAVCSDGIVIDNSQPIISRELLIADRQYYHDREINYIVAEYSFNISWSASDNFGIYDYFVGIASSQSLTSAPDLIPFCSTVRQPFAPLHSNSLTTGRQFYVIIRVEDHALLSDMAVFGPIMLDTSPPVVNGSASVKSDRNIITVFWHVDMIIDDEQVEPISAYEYAVGKLTSSVHNELLISSRVNYYIRRECLTPYRAVKYDCVKLKGFFSYNSVIYCKFCRRYIIVLLVVR